MGGEGRDAWTEYQGKVYNITPYLPFHPGGPTELMKGAGRDVAKLFMEVHSWATEMVCYRNALLGFLRPKVKRWRNPVPVLATWMKLD